MSETMRRKTCLYCAGGVTGVRKGEHIIQAAIGGTLTIKNVCAGCNNVLSLVDRELCSFSPVSVVASQEIESKIWQTWDVDESAERLMLEAFPNWKSNTFTPYPQLIVERCRKLLFYGDADDFKTLGQDQVIPIYTQVIRKSFQSFRSGRSNSIIFEAVEKNQMIERGYRFPPRFFTSTPFPKVLNSLRSGRPVTFILRYLTNDDKLAALHSLENWDERQRLVAGDVVRSSESPFWALSYEMGKVVRAIAKIFVNALSHFSPDSVVDPRVKRVIIGDSGVASDVIAKCGFVDASNISDIKSNSRKEHSLRMIFHGGLWWCWISFFGGRIGAFVAIPGSHNEEWGMLDVVAPIRSRNWHVSKRKFIAPLPHRINFLDYGTMVPSIELLNTEGKFWIEALERKN